MRGIGRRASFLCVMAVMATALMGAAYTLWYEKLTLEANITTGVLDVTWDTFSCGDNEDPLKNGLQFGVSADNWLFTNKNVGSFVSSPYPSDELTLDVTNAYPGYAVDCKLEFLNKGTVPVHIERIFMELDLDNDLDFDDGLIDCILQNGQPSCRNLDPLVDPWPSTVNPAPLYIRWRDGPAFGQGCQVHSGESLTADFFIGVRQPALENQTYRVRLTLQANQWNESGWNDCGDPKGTPIVPVDPPLGSPRENAGPV